MIIFCQVCCGLQSRATYEREWLALFFPDPAELSCYLQAEDDDVEDVERILLGAIDDPVLTILLSVYVHNQFTISFCVCHFSSQVFL